MILLQLSVLVATKERSKTKTLFIVLFTALGKIIWEILFIHEYVHVFKVTPFYVIT